MKSVILSLTAILLAHTFCTGQTVLYNTTTGIYAVQDGTCNSVDLNATYENCPSCYAFNIARYKDTLYVVASNGGLYWMDLKAPGFCHRSTGILLLPGANNLTCDSQGRLYEVSSNNLLRIDPHTGYTENLGVIPIGYAPSGDMSFIDDKLVICAYSGIYYVDIKDPSVAYLIVGNNGYTFYGLVTAPSTCGKNKLFAIGFLPNQSTSSMLGIDPETKTFTGENCTLLPGILDAASLTEDGSTLAIRIDSLFLQSPCGNQATGNAQLFTSSATMHPLTYTLDGTTSNSTGIFSPLNTGSHTVHITNQEGCSTDTTFTLYHGLSAAFNAQPSDPYSCYTLDGAIDITASSQAQPLLFILNNGPPQTSPHFDNLPEGSYSIHAYDAGHCEITVPVSLRYKVHPTFMDGLVVTPAVCLANGGSILITPDHTVDPSKVSVLLNDQPASTLSITGLTIGTYKLSLVSNTTCRYDTSISIIASRNAEPAIRAIVRDPLCAVDDGSIRLNINGPAGPFKTSLDGGPFADQFIYSKLFGVQHSLSTMDKDGCEWDTVMDMKPFVPDPLTISVDSVNPDCHRANSGSFTIQVQGIKAPYSLERNGLLYANGVAITGLDPGEITFHIINRDGCIADSVKAHLQLILAPECDTFFMPNAFTPNGDGRNDLFRPTHSPYLTNFQLLVYNRWGQLVYTSHDHIKGWDGTRNGQPLPADTYAWMIQYENFEGVKRAQRGVVLLIR